MNQTITAYLCAAVCACYLAACTPLAVTPQTAEEKQQAYEKERFPAKIVFDPAAPQAASGFFRMGRVASDNMSNTGVLTKVGNLRDLEMIVDIVNQYTEVRAEISPSITYSDPRLFDLPIIIPQSPPNEIERAQLTDYLLNGDSSWMHRWVSMRTAKDSKSMEGSSGDATLGSSACQMATPFLASFLIYA